MKTTYDVLVAGAGASGLCAAVAEAREGKRVLLLEQSGTVGGTNVQSLVGPLMGFHAGNMRAVGGIAQEIVNRLASRGGTLGHIPDPLGVAATITPIEPEILRQVYYEMLSRERNVTLLLSARLTGAVREGKRVASVHAVMKGGEADFSAAVYIDATGDGDLAALAGAPYTVGREEDGLSQPMTLVLKAAGVDLEKVRAYMAAWPDQFVLRQDADQIHYVAVSGFFEEVEKARERGELTFPRDRVLFFQGVRQGEVTVNMGRVIRRSGTDAWDLTLAEQEGRRQVDEIMTFLRRHIPGFEKAYLAQTGAAIGVRESRHIQGCWTLSELDIQSGAEREDAVAVGAFPIDIHDPLGKELYWTQTAAPCYDVPYRVMLPRDFKNLLVTGRCVSATHVAAASVRVTPTAMALGEAAGIAAALAREGRTDEIDVPLLRQRIWEKGGVPGKKYMKEDRI